MVMFWLFLLLAYLCVAIRVAGALVEMRGMDAHMSLTNIDVIVLSATWPLSAGIIALAKLDGRMGE